MKRGFQDGGHFVQNIRKFISFTEAVLVDLVMLSRKISPLRQAKILSSLFGRISSTQLCKNFGDIHCHERYAIKTFQNGKRSFELSCRGINTSSCYLKESHASNREPEDAVKDESTNMSQFDSAFSDEDDAEISSQRRRSKLPSALADYTLDENGFMKIQDLVDFLKKESAIDICVIKTEGIRQNYVDYFVVVSGISTRHIRAMAKNLEQLVGRFESMGRLKNERITDKSAIDNS